jgi:hypothetical protein
LASRAARRAYASAVGERKKAMNMAMKLARPSQGARFQEAVQYFAEWKQANEGDPAEFVTMKCMSYINEAQEDVYNQWARFLVDGMLGFYVQ